MKVFIENNIWLEWPMFYIASSFDDDALWLELNSDIHSTSNGVIISLNSKTYDEIDDTLELLIAYDKDSIEELAKEKELWRGFINTPESKLFFTSDQEIVFSNQIAEILIRIFKIEEKKFLIILNEEFNIDKSSFKDVDIFSIIENI